MRSPSVFAREGCNIVIADLADGSDAVAELRSLGVAAEAHRVDVTDEAQIVSLFAGIEKLDILVNDVGTYGPVKKIVDMRARGAGIGHSR